MLNKTTILLFFAFALSNGMLLAQSPDYHSLKGKYIANTGKGYLNIYKPDGTHLETIPDVENTFILTLKTCKKFTIGYNSNNALVQPAKKNNYKGNWQINSDTLRLVYKDETYDLFKVSNNYLFGINRNLNFERTK